jgi:serine/threonine-protein kinase RsbW
MAKSRKSGNGSGRGPLTFTINSDFEAGKHRAVQTRILREVEKRGYDPGSVFAIRLSLEEALINAMKHGNKLDPRKTVHVEARVTPKQTEIVIEDQGGGFDRKSVPDPREECNLDKCSGRGILLMEAYMSRVEWTRGGRRVRMVKKNET